jgi:hypothetical protein
VTSSTNLDLFGQRRACNVADVPASQPTSTTPQSDNTLPREHLPRPFDIKHGYSSWCDRCRRRTTRTSYPTRHLPVSPCSSRSAPLEFSRLRWPCFEYLEYSATNQRYNGCLLDEELLTRRRLGKTNLSVKPTQIGTSNATKPENLGPFEYAHLRAPLPKDLKGSEIFPSHSPQQHPETYFLMVSGLEVSRRRASSNLDCLIAIETKQGWFR